MDIQKLLEAQHNKASTAAIISYVGSDKVRFKILIDIFLNGESQLSQRAAWPFSYVCINNPKLVAPYSATLITKLQQPNNHPAVLRNILRIYQELEIPEIYHAQLIDCCFSFILNPSQATATKAFAITVASIISEPHPELKKELFLILNELKQHPQLPAIKSRIKMALKGVRPAKSKF